MNRLFLFVLILVYYSYMNCVELLSPAKDKECAISAIDFGADAVYIGAENFGARKAAFNSIDDIKEVVDYAHKFNVKVYVTLNTILTDSELKKAQKLIKDLEKIKVDALIIQDMGLLSLEHKIPFHASTQCNITSLEKVKFLEDVVIKSSTKDSSFARVNVVLKCFGPVASAVK